MSGVMRGEAAVARCIRSAGLTRLCQCTRGSATIPIAFLDGAVDRAHPSLQEAGIDIVARARGASRAACEHATFIASVFAGTGADCLGLAPACPLLDVAVVDDEMLLGSMSPRESAARLADAVELASRHSRILQISLELSFAESEARPLIAALTTAVQRGVVVVVATGQHPHYPASSVLALPGVIPVSGTDRDGRPLHAVQRAAYVNAFGLFAPAVKIPGAICPIGTALRDGTSFAACFVTAAIALACSAIPQMSPREAAQQLLASQLASRHRGLPATLDADSRFTPSRSTHDAIREELR
jgi:subtilisin family serine protease